MGTTKYKIYTTPYQPHYVFYIFTIEFISFEVNVDRIYCFIFYTSLFVWYSNMHKTITTDNNDEKKNYFVLLKYRPDCSQPCISVHSLCLRTQKEKLLIFFFGFFFFYTAWHNNIYGFGIICSFYLCIYTSKPQSAHRTMDD